MEPAYAVGGTLGVYLGDKAWAGAVMFERDDLDWDAFLTDLRRTVSDDGLLSEYLDVTALRRTRRVEVGGTLRETLERHVRFCQIVWRHDARGTAAMLGVTFLFAVACLAYPLPAFLLTSALHSAVYVAVGVRRWIALLAYPATLVQLPLFAYGLARRTFVWGGRRYRWAAKLDVRTVE